MSSVDALVDEQQALRQRPVGDRLEAAVVDQARGGCPRARRGRSRSARCPGRCPGRSRAAAPAASARTSSGRSKLAVTRWTSSWSSSASIRRRFWRAWVASTSIGGLGLHRELRRLDLDARGLERLAHGLEVGRRRSSTSMGSASVSTSTAPASMASSATSSGSCPSRGTLTTPRGSNCQATAPAPASWPPALVKMRAHVRGGAVAVVRGGLDEDRHAARAVALVDDLLELPRPCRRRRRARWRA